MGLARPVMPLSKLETSGRETATDHKGREHTGRESGKPLSPRKNEKSSSLLPSISFVKAAGVAGAAAVRSIGGGEASAQNEEDEIQDENDAEELLNIVAQIMDDDRRFLQRTSTGGGSSSFFHKSSGNSFKRLNFHFRSASKISGIRSIPAAPSPVSADAPSPQQDPFNNRDWGVGRTCSSGEWEGHACPGCAISESLIAHPGHELHVLPTPHLEI